MRERERERQRDRETERQRDRERERERETERETNASAIVRLERHPRDVEPLCTSMKFLQHVSGEKRDKQ